MPLPTSEAYDFCSIYSQDAVGEPLHATATRADVWLALEYTGRWGARAFAESDLSAAVKAHLMAFQESSGNVRILFISRGGRYEPAPIHFFVAVSAAQPPRLYAFELDAYESLLSLDLAAIALGDGAYDSYRSSDRLFFVCSNGLRDACCAKFGLPVHAAMADVAGDSVWQCTHIGGHRLAPNLLFLPHAVAYGRVKPGEAADLIERYRQNELYLPRLRGRTVYGRPIQAAEHFLREQNGILDVEVVQLLAFEPLDELQWRVTMEAAGTSYSVDVEARRYPETVYKTCNSEERAPVEHYHVLAHQAL
ncbi:MAG: sucrase ferredoxin [Candidatus Promineifilaceae bacterium]|nr:sucrase ferredoxin [Candidatus Promineifilaceae bacterium]